MEVLFLLFVLVMGLAVLDRVAITRGVDSRELIPDDHRR